MSIWIAGWNVFTPWPFIANQWHSYCVCIYRSYVRDNLRNLANEIQFAKGCQRSCRKSSEKEILFSKPILASFRYRRTSSRYIIEATLDFQLDNADIAAWAAKNSLYYIPWQDHWRSYLPPNHNGKGDENVLSYLLLELFDPKMSRIRRIGRLYIHFKLDKKLHMAKQENEPNLPCAHFDPITRRHPVCTIWRNISLSKWYSWWESLALESCCIKYVASSDGST